ncbi:Bug family tripartite tricarboxylate transporter substrate binding protein [Roseomonas sp. BN140053]|uniref:Bug family tripartite tricarboxylate transporter substrate binding protein n=1 Tax=Roseomonas sp. BN140053 TaxID=3391898 RepID=UPI0039E99B2A
MNRFRATAGRRWAAWTQPRAAGPQRLGAVLPRQLSAVRPQRIDAARPRRAALALAAVAALAAAPLPALAQPAWPDRPIRLIVPFPPGGVTDSVGRLSAEWLAARLGQPVVAENRSGGNGAVAADFVARSRPDGYTLLVASASQMVILPALTRVPYDPLRDFTPISVVASNPFVLGVSQRLGVRTLAEFVALVKQQPGQLNYASASNGSGSHLTMALFLQRAGLDMQHVPYRGGGPAVQDLLSGTVSAYFGNPSELMPQMQGDRIRVLASSGQRRSAELGDLPTAAEQGFDGFATETWNGIAGPAGLPPEIAARLARLLGEACGDEGFRRSLGRLGTEPVCNAPDAFAAQIRAEAPVWTEAVRVSGATLD